MSNSDKVSVELVRDGNGRVNISDTLAKFQNDLNQYLLREQADLDQIAVHVRAFWDENPVLRTVSTDALASQVFARLNMPLESYADTTARIKAYVKSATDTFAVMRGKDGGVMLRERLTADELVKADAQAAKLANRKSA